MSRASAKSPRQRPAASGGQKTYRLAVRIPVVIISSVMAVVAIMCILFYTMSRNTVSTLLDEQVNNIASHVGSDQGLR